MLLTEWEIWHTYATYFTAPVPDLRTAAKYLVQSKLLHCAFLDNGEYYWLNRGSLTSGNVDITLSSNRSKGTFAFDKNIKEYAGESLFQSARLRFSELRIFSNEQNRTTHYLRGHLGECRLISQNGYNYHIYPVIKLYETGILIVEFRVMSPNIKINRSDFVDKFVNLFKWEFSQVYIPPALSLIYHQACYLNENVRKSLIARRKFMSLNRNLQSHIEKISVTEKSGDFNFELVPLLSNPEDDQTTVKDNSFEYTERKFSLVNLAEMIFFSVGFMSVGKIQGLSFLLRKPNKPLELGDFWSGRPHIHITRFHGQKNKASENETKYKRDLGWIMARVTKKETEAGERYLPTTSRIFEDFGAYIDRQSTMWVWSKQGLEQEKPWSDPNRGHLVYENQVKCEFLEYGYMLYRHLAEVSGVLEKSDEILSLRQEIAQLEIKLSELSNYGEIQDLMKNGWANMGVNQLKAFITEMNSITQARASIVEQRHSFIWQTVLTLVFGLLLIPSIGSELIKPIWELTGISRGNNENLAALADMAIAFPLVCALILLFWKVLKK